MSRATRGAALAAGAAFAVLSVAGLLLGKRARDERAARPERAAARAWRAVAEDTLPYLSEIARLPFEFDPASGRIRGAMGDPFARARREFPGLVYASIRSLDRAAGTRYPLAQMGDPAAAPAEVERRLFCDHGGSALEVEIHLAAP